MNIAKLFWKKWQVIAHHVGDFQARLVLSIFYFVLLAPFAAVASFFADPLRPKKPRGWQIYSDSQENPLDHARRQF